MISFKRLAQAFIFTFALLAYYPQEVSSQVRSASVVQLRQEYNLLTQKIESAKQLFGNSSSQKIRILIQEAEKRQSEALRYWNEKQYIKARASLKLAFQSINAALQLLLREPLKVQQQKLSVLLQRIEQYNDRARVRDAEKLYKQARDKETQARLSVTNGDFAKALELYRLGITLANKALATFEKTQTLIVEQSRFLDTASRVRDAIDASANNAAERVYEQAIKQGKNAASAYREGQPVIAAELYNEAMKLLLRAFDIASATQNINQNDLQIELHAVENLLENARIKFGNSQVRGVKLMLNRAQKNTLNAGVAIDRGDYQLARAQLRFARGIINRLYRNTSGSGSDMQERAIAELQQLQMDIDAFAARTGNAVQSESNKYLALAQRSATGAETAIQNRRFNIALNRILIGQRFLAKAEDNANASASNISEAAAKSHIMLLEQSLQQAEISEVNNQFEKSLLNEAKRMLQQANKQLSDQQYALAFELADVGLELTEKALRAAQNQ